MLGGESLVGVCGGQGCDGRHLASVNIDVFALDGVYVFGFCAVLPTTPCIISSGAVTDTGHPSQVSLLGRFHVGHSPVLDKHLY